MVLLGRQGGEITADELAEKMGTINYGIVCMIGSRVPKIYRGQEAKRQEFLQTGEEKLPLSLSPCWWAALTAPLIFYRRAHIFW